MTYKRKRVMFFGGPWVRHNVSTTEGLHVFGASYYAPVGTRGESNEAIEARLREQIAVMIRTHLAPDRAR